MFSALFMLAASFGTTYSRAVQIADIALWTSQRHDARAWYPEETDPDFARYRMAALLVTFAFYESSFDSQASGDGGKACGLMQVHPKRNGATCKQMQESAWVAMDEGARVIDESIKQCGSLHSALGAYVSGRCGVAMDIVRQRCARSHGGC